MGVGPGVTAWNVTFTLTLAFTFEMVNVPPDFGTSSKPLADATSKPLSGVMVMVTLSPSVTDEALAEDVYKRQAVRSRQEPVKLDDRVGRYGSALAALAHQDDVVQALSLIHI